MLLSYPVYRAVRVSAAAAAIAIFLTASPGARPAAPNKESRIAELQQWVAAIDAHAPGEIDPPVVRLAMLTPRQRVLLLEVAAPFTAYLRDRDESVLRRLSADERAALALLAQQLSAAQTFAKWLHRAVMLETDVAVLAPELTAEAMRDARGIDLAEGIHAEDGELGVRDLLNWHWGFARQLVDARDQAASNDFAAAWYHAVALYQLDHMLLGELAPHVMKGFQTFPEDARIQFDSACLADAFGSRRVQALLISNQRTDFRPSIPAADATNMQAKRQFARVLALDSSFVEARVRLARLEIEEGNYDDALALIGTAFKLPMSRQLEYMAHLIAGRANAALRHVEAAAAHFNAALKLFPSAQTPVISLSLLSLQAGDLDRASALAASLGPNANSDERNDPWWSYYQATWLGETELLDRLRDQVRR